MKQGVVRVIRSMLPMSAVRVTEEAYRRSRTTVISTLYGRPARSLKVIGVTGTNGKTTTVNYINEILKEAGLKTAMFSTATIEVAGQSRPNDMNVTVASVATMQKFFRSAKRKKVEYVVMEFPSHALHQHKLDDVPVEVAVMTNLTQDHMDYHGTMDEYAAVKAKLFKKKPAHIVLNRDDEWFEYFDTYQPRQQKITYGTHPEAEAHIQDIKLYRKGTEAKVAIDHQTRFELATNLPGEFNAYNMVAAASVAYLLGRSVEEIQEGIANLEAVPGRYERVDVDAPYEVIVDYAHTPDALEKLLSSAKKLTKGRVVLVFGSCGDRDKGKRPIMGEIAAREADRIFLTDEESYSEDPKQIRGMIMEGIERTKGGPIKTTEIADRRDAIKKALDVAKKGDTILITGLGHEQYRIVGDERIAWNDGDIVKELLS